MPEPAPLVCPGDLVALRQCDHMDADRPVRLRVVEIWPSPEEYSWVQLDGWEINANDTDRDGKAVSVRAYKDALRRPGVVTTVDRGKPAGPR